MLFLSNVCFSLKDRVEVFSVASCADKNNFSDAFAAFEKKKVWVEGFSRKGRLVKPHNRGVDNRKKTIKSSLIGVGSLGTLLGAGLLLSRIKKSKPPKILPNTSKIATGLTTVLETPPISRERVAGGMFPPAISRKKLAVYDIFEDSPIAERLKSIVKKANQARKKAQSPRATRRGLRASSNAAEQEILSGNLTSQKVEDKARFINSTERNIKKRTEQINNQVEKIKVIRKEWEDVLRENGFTPARQKK